jgi:hypothetical protein
VISTAPVAIMALIVTVVVTAAAAPATVVGAEETST